MVDENIYQEMEIIKQQMGFGTSFNTAMHRILRLFLQSSRMEKELLSHVRDNIMQERIEDFLTGLKRDGFIKDYEKIVEMVYPLKLVIDCDWIRLEAIVGPKAESLSVALAFKEVVVKEAKKKIKARGRRKK